MENTRTFTVDELETLIKDNYNKQENADESKFRTDNAYDMYTSGDTLKNLMYDDFVHGYTTAQLRKAKEEFNYWKEHLEMMRNSPIVEDNEEFLGE